MKFSAFFSQQIRILRKRFSQLCVRSTTQRRTFCLVSLSNCAAYMSTEHDMCSKAKLLKKFLYLIKIIRLVEAQILAPKRTRLRMLGKSLKRWLSQFHIASIIIKLHMKTNKTAGVKNVCW